MATVSVVSYFIFS